MRQAPFHLSAPAPSELDIHAATARALDRLLMPPAFWFSYPVGHVNLTGGEMARLMRIGLKRALPDIFVVFEGLVFGIELKKPGARLSKTRLGRTKKGSPRIYEGQEDVFPKLRAAGITIAVAHSVDEALAAIRKFGIPLRPHTL